MAQFAYNGRDPAGSPVAGKLEAPSRRDALRILSARGYQVARVSEEAAGAARPKNKSRRAKPAPVPGSKVRRLDRLFEWSFEASKDTTPRRKERLPFLEALYELTSSGLSAGEAVRLLSIRLKEPRLRRLSGNLWEQISEGAPLSRAMASQNQVFDPSAINLIQVKYPLEFIEAMCVLLSTSHSESATRSRLFTESKCAFSSFSSPHSLVKRDISLFPAKYSDL